MLIFNLFVSGAFVLYTKTRRTFGRDVLTGVSFHIGFVQIGPRKVLMRDLLLDELNCLAFCVVMKLLVCPSFVQSKVVDFLLLRDLLKIGFVSHF